MKIVGSIISKLILSGALAFVFQVAICQDTNRSLISEFNNRFEQVELLKQSKSDSSLLIASTNLSIATKIGVDSILIKAHKQIGEIHYNNYSYDSAIVSYSIALEIAKSSGNRKLEAASLEGLGLALKRNEQEFESLEKGLEALNIYKELDDEMSVAWTSFSLAIDYKQLGEVDSAKTFLSRALTSAEALEIGSLEIRIHNIFGNIYSDEGNHLKALEHYHMALVPAEETSFERAMTALYTNIAILHKDQDDYEKAEEYYLKSLAIDRKNEYDRIHLVQYNLGVMYKAMGRLDESLVFLRQAYMNRLEMGLLEKQMVTALMIAEVYVDLNNYDSVNHYANLGEQLINRVNDPREKAFAYEQLAEINLAKKNYGEAEKQFLQAHDIYKQIGNLEYYSFTAESLYDLFKRTGDSDKSLYFLELHMETKDSLLNKENIRELTRIEESYKHNQEILVKQNEIVLLESKEQLANLRITLLVISILAVSIFGFLIARYLLRKKERKKRELEEIGQFKEAMTGMIAHDLKNPLAIILGTESEKPSTRLMARQMLNLVNNMLDVHKFESTSVLLDTTNWNINKIITEAIEQVRPLMSEKNLSIVNNVRDDYHVQVDFEYLLRVFVNLFTNAIKYSSNNQVIEVLAEKSNNGKLKVSVRDHGAGIAKENVNKIFQTFGQVDPRKSGGVGSTGLGLSFCQLAIRAHGSELLVESEIGVGTEFIFELQFVENGEKESSENKSEIIFSMSEEERLVVIAKISELKELKLHQAFAIEEVLESIELESQAISDWAEQVLNAAYANNEPHFQELLDMVESDYE